MFPRRKKDQPTTNSNEAQNQSQSSQQVFPPGQSDYSGNDQPASSDYNNPSQTPEGSAIGSNENSEDENTKESLLSKINIFSKLPAPYLMGLVALLIVGGLVIFYVQSTTDDEVVIDGSELNTTSLSEADLANLASDRAQIDSTNRILTVAANSIFDGTMLVRSSLDVQGQLRVGQSLSINDVDITGQGVINDLDIANELNVQGNVNFGGAATIQNGLTIGDGLSVTGSGTFAGNLSANSIEAGNLTFNGNLTMNGHIITSGTQVSASNGPNIGSGGTVSVSGNDVAGTVNINTGSGTSTGIMVTVTFAESYTGTPRVNITPVGSASGGQNWYVTRNSNSFSVGINNPITGNFSFDYFVVE
ncbi:MAG: hypothetical protein WD061_01020 [Candidatus Saccharimonadales bacterium]